VDLAVTARDASARLPPDDGVIERSRRPIRLLTVAWLITLAVLAALGWSAWDSHHRLASVVQRAHQIQALQGRIVYLDEVLTMSARMAAESGDLSWEKRYREFEPQLDAAIKEALELLPDFKGAKQTDAANERLVRLENLAFDFVRQKQAQQAAELLGGAEYAALKSVYAQPASVDVAAEKRGSLLPGAFFGEMSLLDGGPRSATIVAETPVRLLVINRRHFSVLLKDVPRLTQSPLMTLSRRVRQAEENAERMGLGGHLKTGHTWTGQNRP